MSTTMKAAWSFHGGVKLHGHKTLSMQTPITQAPLPAQLVLPLQQHIGKAAKAIVKTGDRVLKGQCIAQSSDKVSAAVHAPTSGEIIAIEDRPVPHPVQPTGACIVIKPDGEDAWIENLKPIADYQHLSAKALQNIVLSAGIVGLGGAGFPSHLKLAPGKKLDTLIINAAECEPYITCDAMLMQERASEIIQGITIILHALDIPRCLIGIEDNKPDAKKALQQVIEKAAISTTEIIEVPTRYPTGGEKQLIRALTGKEIPINGFPFEKGIICHNVATCYAIAEAILKGKPLIDRVVTITGEGIQQPVNLQVLLGSPMRSLLKHCQYQNKPCHQLLMGGPMMGFEIKDTCTPIIKTTNCLLVTKQSAPPTVMPCIRCGECARVCPANLLPQQLYWYARAKDFDRIQEFQLFSCIECGCCDYVCPSHIPLVQFYRFSKSEIWAQEVDKNKANTARQRHEFRQLRLERKKQEDTERKRRKKELLKKVQGNGNDEQAAKKAAIEAALKRVKDRREQQEVVTKNTNNLTAEQQQAISDIDIRRKKSNSSTGENKS